jgi:hypothetical protein
MEAAQRLRASDDFVLLSQAFEAECLDRWKAASLARDHPGVLRSAEDFCAMTAFRDFIISVASEAAFRASVTARQPKDYTP